MKGYEILYDLVVNKIRYRECKSSKIYFYNGGKIYVQEDERRYGESTAILNEFLQADFTVCPEYPLSFEEAFVLYISLETVESEVSKSQFGRTKGYIITNASEQEIKGRWRKV